MKRDLACWLIASIPHGVAWAVLYRYHLLGEQLRDHVSLVLLILCGSLVLSFMLFYVLRKRVGRERSEK